MTICCGAATRAAHSNIASKKPETDYSRGYQRTERLIHQYFNNVQTSCAIGLKNPTFSIVLEGASHVGYQWPVVYHVSQVPLQKGGSFLELWGCKVRMHPPPDFAFS